MVHHFSLNHSRTRASSLPPPRGTSRPSELLCGFRPRRHSFLSSKYTHFEQQMLSEGLQEAERSSEWKYGDPPPILSNCANPRSWTDITEHGDLCPPVTEEEDEVSTSIASTAAQQSISPLPDELVAEIFRFIASELPHSSGDYHKQVTASLVLKQVSRQFYRVWPSCFPMPSLIVDSQQACRDLLNGKLSVDSNSGEFFLLRIFACKDSQKIVKKIVSVRNVEFVPDVEARGGDANFSGWTVLEALKRNLDFSSIETLSLSTSCFSQAMPRHAWPIFTNLVMLTIEFDNISKSSIHVPIYWGQLLSPKVTPALLYLTLSHSGSQLEYGFSIFSSVRKLAPQIKSLHLNRMGRLFRRQRLESFFTSLASLTDLYLSESTGPLMSKPAYWRREILPVWINILYFIPSKLQTLEITDTYSKTLNFIWLPCLEGALNDTKLISLDYLRYLSLRHTCTDYLAGSTFGDGLGMMLERWILLHINETNGSGRRVRWAREDDSD